MAMSGAPSALPLNALPPALAPPVAVLKGDADAPLPALPCPAAGRCAASRAAWLALGARGMDAVRGSGMLAWGEGALELTMEEGSTPLLSVLLARCASAGVG